ncbi:MAG: isoprenylcysteine carboxylmethyltransferase family protein [Synergistetes bacterium]|nr:isoprenylcysteine carboxylmethyltransferase family protein [Synergistota bacterium]
MYRESIIHLIGHIVYITLYGVLIVSAVLFYNSLNSVRLLCAGWIILVVGIIFLMWASKSRKKGRMEENLIEIGAYAFVRHPGFLGHILIVFALVIISQHWVSLIVGAILISLLCFAMIEEEKRNIKKFGEAYGDYIKRVPRMNLVAGIIRQIRSRREDGNE